MENIQSLELVSTRLFEMVRFEVDGLRVLLVDYDESGHIAVGGRLGVTG
jgi:hypothetical protein